MLKQLLLSTCLFASLVADVKEEVLTPPRLDAENIQGYITCVRPMREGVFRIEAETISNKLIIHNYGHGGSGWTLLPGSVNHAIKLFTDAQASNEKLKKNKKVTVIGAGCNGLLTAIRLKQAGYDVKIVAERVRDLTSHKAAGLLAPVSMKTSPEAQAQVDAIGFDAFSYYKKQAESTQPEFKGISFMPVYVIGDEEGAGLYPLVNAGHMAQPEDVKIRFEGGATHEAKKFMTIFMNTKILMKELSKKVKQLKIPIIRKKVKEFAEIETAAIFNCSGLGARGFGDEKMIPVQGHLIALKKEPIRKLQYMIYAKMKVDGEYRYVYFMPKAGGTLGGTFIEGEESYTSNQQEFGKILERSKTFFFGTSDTK